MGTGKWRSARLPQIAGLAVIALVVATVLGSPDLGLLLAGGLVVGELLWTTGSLALRSWRRKQESKT